MNISDIPHAFFVSLAVAVTGIVVAIINMLTAMKRIFSSGETKSVIIVHVLAGLMYVLGGLGAIGFGIAWIVTYLKH